MPAQRQRFKQTQSFKQRLLERVKGLREEARQTKPGVEREALLRKARQTETAAHIDEWLRSPGLNARRLAHGAAQLPDLRHWF